MNRYCRETLMQCARLWKHSMALSLFPSRRKASAFSLLSWRRLRWRMTLCLSVCALGRCGYEGTCDGPCSSVGNHVFTSYAQPPRRTCSEACHHPAGRCSASSPTRTQQAETCCIALPTSLANERTKIMTGVTPAERRTSMFFTKYVTYLRGVGTLSPLKLTKK